METVFIGVNSIAFGRKLTLFFAPSRFPAFHLKCPAFLAYFELEKMHSMCYFQRQVELKTNRQGADFVCACSAQSKRRF